MDELQAWESDPELPEIREQEGKIEKLEDEQIDPIVDSDVKKLSKKMTKNLTSSARVGNESKQKKFLKRKTRDAIKSAAQLGIQLKDLVFVIPKDSQIYFD